MTDKPLFVLMDEAFESALTDDCIYEWHLTAAAMIRAIADRMVKTQDSGSSVFDAALWLYDEAAIADAYQPPEDPRNDPDYDTFPYGTEPIPGDTTWAQTKAPDS